MDNIKSFEPCSGVMDNIKVFEPCSMLISSRGICATKVVVYRSLPRSDRVRFPDGAYKFYFIIINKYKYIYIFMNYLNVK